jgi:polysaccharide chain length determinant protein (PEP-CTERM system associated)
MNEQLNQILRYVEGVWIYRWQALLIAWIVAIAGWAFVYMQPNSYQVGTVINVDTYSIIDPLLKGITVDLNAGNELNATTKILLGRENLSGILRKLGIDSKGRTPAEWERMINKLRSNIQIDISGGGRSDSNGMMYGIHYKDASAERAYRVVSLLSQGMIEKSLKSGRTDVASAENFLDTQIADYEKRLTLAEQRLADFKKKNVGMMPDEKGSYYAHIQSDMDEIDKTRTALELAKRRQAELTKQLSGETPLLGSGADPVATKLRRSEAELADLLDHYTDQHPDVVRLKARIAKLKAGVDVGDETPSNSAGNAKSLGFNPVYQDLRRELSKADVEVESLKIQLADQERKTDEIKSNLDTMPEIEAQLSRLNRDYEVTKSRYLDLVSRRESAQLSQEAAQHSSDRTLRIIEPPILPVSPSYPNRPLLLSGVLAAAVASGVGLALLLVLLHRTFMGDFDVKKLIGLPVLGTVSLNLKPEEVKKQRSNLVLFASVTVLLLGLYGGVLVFRDTGSSALRAWVHENGLSL